ncbi:hypothetical protein PT974_12246 [Cladobotryum mycophilum]|uniref:2EXR domain-containing protein n=1 Tax=Cladobotryum mycophilum TaxID=491253 RepID=A0ABR0S7G6_9HYPO
MARFQDLPFELRREIWRLTLENRRVICLLEIKSPGMWFTRFPTGSPVILYVNQESRAEGLRRYTRTQINRRLEHNLPTEWAPAEPCTGFFLDPICDTLDISISTVDRHMPMPFEALALVPMIKESRVQHVRLQPELWSHVNFEEVIKTIVHVTRVKTLTFHVGMFCNVNTSQGLMIRIVTDHGLPRKTVTWRITEEDALVRNDNRGWGFAPVKEALIRDGAIHFNHDERFGLHEVAMFLVVPKEDMFPEEFIWALAAGAADHPDISDGFPFLPDEGTATSWKHRIFQNLDGVCLPDFGFDGLQPPHVPPPPPGMRCYTDITTSAVGLLLWTLLNAASIWDQDDWQDLAWLIEWQTLLIDAMVWGKDIEYSDFESDEDLQPLEKLGAAEVDAIREVLKEHMTCFNLYPVLAKAPRINDVTE